MNVHPIFDPEGADWALDFQTSAGVLRAVPEMEGRGRYETSQFFEVELVVSFRSVVGLTNEPSDSSSDEVITKFLSLGLREWK